MTPLHSLAPGQIFQLSGGNMHQITSVTRHGGDGSADMIYHRVYYTDGRANCFGAPQSTKAVKFLKRIEPRRDLL